MSRLIEIAIDDSALPPPTPEIEQERKVAIFDLLEDNSFALPLRDDRPVPPGPYRLTLAIRERRLVFDIDTEAKIKTAIADVKFDVEIDPYVYILSVGYRF